MYVLRLGCHIYDQNTRMSQNPMFYVPVLRKQSYNKLFCIVYEVYSSVKTTVQGRVRGNTFREKNIGMSILASV